MTKIGVIGAFGFRTIDTGGQPVKTRSLYYGLIEHYGADNVLFLETMGWTRNPVRMFYQLMELIRKCDILIMLPAQNGVNVFSRILLQAQKKGKMVFYDVIGGWLPELTQQNINLRAKLQEFNGIWVETDQMRIDLADQGFDNVMVVPNFKDIHPLFTEDMTFHKNYPLPLCTFSRVIKEKGIEDAIDAVTKINTKHGMSVFTLDIYGEIGEAYREEFRSRQNDFPPYISYRGVASPDKSVETLMDYYLLLFPTHYPTEGIPGTLIDAYCAGVPVISALWRNHIGIFDDGVVGYGYALGNTEAFTDCLEYAASHIEEVNMMKTACLKKAASFSKAVVMRQIVEMIQHAAERENVKEI